MAANLNPPLTHAINGVAMTARQHETARAFARSGYKVGCFSYGAIVLQRVSIIHRTIDEVYVNVDGEVVPDYLR